MLKTLLIVALGISTIASAADLSRCGKDQFGNFICRDKDGVLTLQSKTAEESGNEVAKSGVSAVQSKEMRGVNNGKLRCGIDPFGNEVCR